MATSTEQITDLIQGYTSLKTFFEGIQDRIEAELRSSASRFEGFFNRFYVDQVAGDDDNPGSEAAPVKTIERAIALTPFSGWSTIYVRGNYLTSERIVTNGRSISLAGCIAGSNWVPATDPAQRPTLQLGYYGNGSYAEVAGFHCGYDAFLDIVYFDVALPSKAAVEAALPGKVTGSVPPRSVFAVRSSSFGRAGAVSLRYSNINVPADYYGQLLSGDVGWLLRTHSVTFDGDIAGKVHPDVPAGTSADAAVRHVQTDLATL